MSRKQRIALLIVAVLVALYVGARLRYPGRAPVKLSAASCDARLWDRVYEKNRLEMLEPCTAVEGRVRSVHHNEDGDVHIALAPDRPSVLNLVNVTHANGELVVEIVCEHVPPEDPAKSICQDFHSSVTVPNVGDHVRVTGSYVTDRDHGWNEIHPVTRIEVLR